MTEYDNNETVTLSLERYEKLKENQIPVGAMMVMQEDERKAWKIVDDFLEEKGYCRVFHSPEMKPMQIMTKEEFKKLP